MDSVPRVIEGRHVFLAPERRENVPLYWKWASDREVTRLTKGYGRAFIQSLPPMKRTRELPEVQQFLRERLGEVTGDQ